MTSDKGATHMITFYHYPRCSTCVKARKWLEAQGVAFQAVDLASAPPSAAELKAIHTASGKPLKALFNTSGQSYRGGGFKERLPSMSEAEQLKALAADGMLIKRPIAVGASFSLIGFKLPEWEERLG